MYNINYLNSMIKIIILISRLENNDSCNGSKTQSATTTESNTPENTVRMDSIDLSSKMAGQQQKISHSFTDSGDLIVDG